MRAGLTRFFEENLDAWTDEFARKYATDRREGGYLDGKDTSRGIHPDDASGRSADTYREMVLGCFRPNTASHLARDAIHE